MANVYPYSYLGVKKSYLNKSSILFCHQHLFFLLYIHFFITNHEYKKYQDNTVLHTFTGRHSSRSFSSPTSAYSPNLATLGTNRAQEEIVRALKILLSRQESQDADKKRLNEWRVIAIAVDRILFWIFFFVTTISSLVFLVILPVVKRSEYVRNT